jgi:CheY-like chemotaxis protein
MPRILAIESDPKRREVLSALVREHVKATLVVVPSVRAAIASIAERTPDLIIAPTLLSPPDEAELLTHMKGLDSAPYIQMLTVPALDMLADAPAHETRRRGLFGPVFNRRPVSLGLQYDRGMVAAQIVDGLERARALRIEYATMLAYQEAMGSVPSSIVLARSSDMATLDATSTFAREATSTLINDQLREQARDERRIALRKGRGDVPWLSGIKASWGADLQLINISSTGVLVETGSKFAPGSTTNLHLSGPETTLVVPVRFIRSDVARIDGLGVRYRAAAAFANELDLAGPRRAPAAPATPPQELAALLGAVLVNASERQEPAHTRFAQGLRQLIGARDVQVRAGSTGSAGGRETLYFDVPGDDRSRATLQVMFDRNHDVTDAEFRLLKAAAWLTAAVLELEKPDSSAAERPATMALLSERVA